MDVISEAIAKPRDVTTHCTSNGGHRIGVRLVSYGPVVVATMTTAEARAFAAEILTAVITEEARNL